MRLLLLALFSLFAGAAAGEDRFFDAGGTIERSWINTGILQNLARDHRVIAFDLRGHGHSGKPHDPAAYEATGTDVIALLDHLQIARAHVVGYSLGGIIVIKLLTTHPQRFASAVLVRDAEVGAVRVPANAGPGSRSKWYRGPSTPPSTSAGCRGGRSSWRRSAGILQGGPSAPI